MTDTPAAAGTLVERLRASGTLMWNGGADDRIAAKILHEAADALSACQAELAVKSKQHVEAHANVGELFATICEISQLTHLHGEVDEYAAVVEAVRAIVDAKEQSERLLAAAEKALAAEKGDADMIARAWQRELCEQGINYRSKAHWIDYMVLATRHVMALAKGGMMDDIKAIQLAYGFLWHITTDDKRTPFARRVLSDRLTHEQRGEGITAARAEMPGIQDRSQSESLQALLRSEL